MNSVYGVLFLVLFCWNMVISILLYRQFRTNRTLLGEERPRALTDIVLEQMGKIGEMHIELSELGKKVRSMHEGFIKTIQSVGLVRFSPFEDTGGDQSFSIALLDGHRSGVIISSLHGRDKTRLYAKLVYEGNGSGHALSNEEKQAIEQAVSRYTGTELPKQVE